MEPMSVEVWLGARYVRKALGSKYLGQVVVNDEKLDVLEYVQWTKKEHYIGTFGTDEFLG